MKILRPSVSGLWLLLLGLVALLPPGFAQSTPREKKNSLGMRLREVVDGVWMSVHETRVRDFAAFVEAGGKPVPPPSFEQGQDHPVVNVSWEDAQRFCLWLTGVERGKGAIAGNHRYRLPTEQEWMRAAGLEPSDASSLARNGGLVFAWGDAWPPPPEAGNFDPKLGIESHKHTAPVGSCRVNPNGFYDLSGNVWEWCADTFEGVSDMRVLKGGSWRMREPSRLALNRRIGNACGLRLPTYGFRVVLSVEKSGESSLP